MSNLVVEEVGVPLAKHPHVVLQRHPHPHRPFQFGGRHRRGRRYGRRQLNLPAIGSAQPPNRDVETGDRNTISEVNYSL